MAIKQTHGAAGNSTTTTKVSIIMKNLRYYNYELVFDKVNKKHVNVCIYRMNIRDAVPVKTLYGFISKKEAVQYAKAYMLKNNMIVKHGLFGFVHLKTI